MIQLIREWVVESVKLAISWVVWQMTKRRYVGKYPKFKKFVLASALIIVDGFVLTVLYGLIPKIETRFVYENTASAAEIVNEEAPAVEEPSKDCYEAVERFGWDNKDLLRRIVDAESSNDHTASSKLSTARGCAQWIFGSWESYGKRYWGSDFYKKNVYNADDNIELAAWTIREYGTSPWDASRAKWSK